MKDLRCVTLHFYFKILDADIFGGKDTVGYAATSNAECLGSDKISFDEMVSIEGFNDICDGYRKILSSQMEVPVENIIPISRDEYKENKCTCENCNYFMYSEDNHEEYYCNRHEAYIKDLEICDDYISDK